MDGADDRLLPVKPARPRQRVQLQQQQHPAEGPEVAEESAPVPSKLAHWIKLNMNELKIRQTDRSWAAEVVNDFRENMLKFLKSNTDQPFFQSAEFLTTGSYFEKVKIKIPNEFDMMLKLPAPSTLNMTPLDGGLFYRIDLSRPNRSPIRAFVIGEELTLSSSHFLSETYRLVRKFLKTYKVPDKRCRWAMNRKQVYCPAVTLSLCRTENHSDELISMDLVPALEVQRWPSAVKNGPDVGDWLGKKVRQELKSLPCYFVPKRLKGRNVAKDAKESWRISFSHIEKKIMASHGNKKTCCESHATKCCRKQCLMLLKSLIESLKLCFPKELDDLCSYHGKTVFFHTLSSRFDDSAWTRQQLPACFLHLVDALEDHARTGVLPHFFVPECNLFSSTVFPRKALAFLVSALEEQKRDGLPLLRPAAPAGPLRPEMAAAGSPAKAGAETFLSPARLVELRLMLMLVFALAVAFTCRLI